MSSFHKLRGKACHGPSSHPVTAPQFPETSLAAGVARLRQVLRRRSGPTVVVGHSYAGQIMTSLGTHARTVQRPGARTMLREPGGPYRRRSALSHVHELLSTELSQR